MYVTQTPVNQGLNQSFGLEYAIQTSVYQGSVQSFWPYICDEDFNESGSMTVFLAFSMQVDICKFK